MAKKEGGEKGDKFLPPGMGFTDFTQQVAGSVAGSLMSFAKTIKTIPWGHTVVTPLSPLEQLKADFSSLKNSGADLPTITGHLNAIIESVVREERLRGLQESNTGPCLEHFLMTNVFAVILQMWHMNEPLGVRRVVTKAVRALLEQISQPLLPHLNIWHPLSKMLEAVAHPSFYPSLRDAERTEVVECLAVVCERLQRSPATVQFFLNTGPTPGRINALQDTGNENQQSPPDDLAARRKRMGSVSGGTMSGGTFPLFNALLPFLSDPQPANRREAQEAVRHCLSLPGETITDFIVTHTRFTSVVCETLVNSYKTLPSTLHGPPGAKMATEVFQTEQFKDFQSQVKFICTVANSSHSALSADLSSTLASVFFQPVLLPALLQQSETGYIAATHYLRALVNDMDAPPIRNQLISFILGPPGTIITAPQPQQQAAPRSLAATLIARMNGMTAEVSVPTLQLFMDLLELKNHHVMHNLVLLYLEDLYFLTRAPDLVAVTNSGPATPTPKLSLQWLPEFLREAPSAADAPSSWAAEKWFLHFLSSASLTSQKYDDALVTPGLEAYIADARPGMVYCMESVDAWNLAQSFMERNQQVTPFSITRMARKVDDDPATSPKTPRRPVPGASPSTPVPAPEARPVNGSPLEEALSDASYELRGHHGEGLFVGGILDKLENLLELSFEENLLVTGLCTQLARHPHPSLRAFFLDPADPIHPWSKSTGEVRTLITVLDQLKERIETKAAKIPNYKAALGATWQALQNPHRPLEDVGQTQQRFLQAVVVLEEFCKEMAATAHVSVRLC